MYNIKIRVEFIYDGEFSDISGDPKWLSQYRGTNSYKDTSKHLVIWRHKNVTILFL